MSIRLLCSSLAAAGALLTQAASAQEFIPVDLPTETNQVGAGVYAVPDFYGADGYHVEGAPFLHANLSNGMWIRLIGFEGRLNLIPTDLTQAFPQLGEFRAGLLWRSRQSRDNDMGDEVVKRMRPIPAASEAGVFASYSLPMAGDPLHKIVFSGDASWNTNSVYTGAIGNIRATYFYPFPQQIAGLSLLGSAGFSLFFTSDHFTNRYFGIDAQDVALFPERGGVPYEARGGLTSIRIPFQLTSQIQRNVSLTVAGRYERLLQDAADSPIVRSRGNENQWVIGVSANYLF
jgi:outer membrane protein